jgi:hypothetical protein
VMLGRSRVQKTGRELGSARCGKGALRQRNREMEEGWLWLWLDFETG